MGIISHANCTSVALNSGATFTGVAENCVNTPSIVVSALTDQDGVLYIELSVNGTNWDSSLPYSVNANVNEVHRITATKAYFRIRFENTSVSNQTFLRLQTIIDSHQIISSPLNSIIQQDADSIVTRGIDAEIAIAQGLFQNYSIVNKVGLNPDIDAGSTPEDIWGDSGTYTGWATAAETLQVFSSNAADASAGTGARTVVITGLDSNYNVASETVTLNGTTPVTTTQSFLRCHTMRTVTAGSGGVNAGTITVRQSTTTANVMLFMRIGLNQTNDGVYTIPAGYTGYLTNMHASVRGSSGAIISAGIWTRSFGSVFRQRRPFSFSQTAQYIDNIYGGLAFTEKTDLTYRSDSCSANNAEAVVSFDILLVKN